MFRGCGAFSRSPLAVAPIISGGAEHRSGSHPRDFRGTSRFPAKQPLGLKTDKINREKSYDVKVCLRDVFNNQLITDENFLIRGGEEELSRITNAEGCLFWTEKVKFNYLASETFGTLTRRIVERAPRRGCRNQFGHRSLEGG